MSRNHVRAGLGALVLAGCGLSTAAIQAQQPARTVDAESRLIAALQGFSEQEMKEHYLRCSDAALRGMLGSPEIALCSLGYEVLLRRVFGGDFLALHAWSKRQPADPGVAGRAHGTAAAHN